MGEFNSLLELNTLQESLVKPVKSFNKHGGKIEAQMKLHVYKFSD